MAKLTKWEKEELLMILKNKRSGMRCDLVKELNEKALDLTPAISLKIDKLSKELKNLNNKRDVILNQHLLLNLGAKVRYGCDTSKLHPDLQRFDEETDDSILKIILGQSGDTKP